MTTVYLDESGDLGFDLTKASTSRHFLVTALVCEDTKPVEKAVKKVFAGFTKAEVRHHHGYLHAFNEKPETRRKLLRLLADLDITVLVVTLDKRRVFTDDIDDPHVLYNALVNTLMNRLMAQDDLSAGGQIRLVASLRETFGLLNDTFTAYLLDRVRTPPGVSLIVDVRHATAEKGLQAADLVSWSMFRWQEHGDHSYADLIHERVREVTDVFG